MNVPPPVHTPLVLLQRCSFELSPTHRPTVDPPPGFWNYASLSSFLPTERECTLASFGPSQRARERERERERESRRGLSALTDRCPRRRPLKRGGAAAAAVAAAAAAAAPDKHTFRGKESSSPLLFGELAFSSSPTPASASSFADWTYVPYVRGHGRLTGGVRASSPRTPNTARTYCNAAPRRGRGGGKEEVCTSKRGQRRAYLSVRAPVTCSEARASSHVSRRRRRRPIKCVRWETWRNKFKKRFLAFRSSFCISVF